MKPIILIFSFLMATWNMSVQTKDNVNDIFKSIKPSTLNCSISFNVRIRNDKGEVIGIRNLMNMSDLELKDKIDNYSNKEELIKYLKYELQNGQYDWEANIILYYINQEDCINMFPYQPDKVKEWRVREKVNCLKFWIEKK